MQALWAENLQVAGPEGRGNQQGNN